MTQMSEEQQAEDQSEEASPPEGEGGVAEKPEEKKQKTAKELAHIETSLKFMVRRNGFQV